MTDPNKVDFAKYSKIAIEFFELAKKKMEEESIPNVSVGMLYATTRFNAIHAATSTPENVFDVDFALQFFGDIYQGMLKDELEHIKEVGENKNPKMET